MRVAKPQSPTNRKSPRLLPAVPSLQSPTMVLIQLINVGIFAMLISAAASFEDRTNALAFYGVYHRNPWNQLLHFFGVPLILWTMLIFQAHLPLPSLGIGSNSKTNPIILSMPGIPRHYPSWATLAALFYVFFYFAIDVTGAFCYLFVLYAMYATAVRWVVHDQLLAAAQSTHTVRWRGTGQPVAWALGLHAFSWYLQIHPGHGVLEGAQPAVLASVGGALSTAPLFAFYEGLWWCGIGLDLQRHVAQVVAEATSELCAAGSPMRVCLSS